MQGRGTDLTEPSGSLPRTQTSGRLRFPTACIRTFEDCSHEPPQSPLGSGSRTTGPEVLRTTELNGGKVNRGIIGVIIGVLVIIILVIVILQLT
jgi:hypothetical protein